MGYIDGIMEYEIILEISHEYSNDLNALHAAPDFSQLLAADAGAPRRLIATDSFVA